MPKLTRLAKYTWGVLVYNIFVIVYGALVRATGSGAGCGSHWPSCNGVLVPLAPAVETIIEFVHRVTSGITILLIIGLIVWAWKKYPKGSLLRWTSGAAVLFIISESLLGAGLVLFNLVQENASIARAIAMMVHLVNTFLLLASLTLTAWFTTFGSPKEIDSRRTIRWLVALGAAGLLILGASGAIAALGDTLFPSSSLVDGLEKDFSNTSNYLLRIRIFHPLIAIVSGCYAVGFGFWLRQYKPGIGMNRITGILAGLIAVQLGLGLVNVLLLAPVWIQLLHLFLTCLIWISYVLTSVLGLVTRDFTGGVIEHPVHDRVHQSTAQ